MNYGNAIDLNCTGDAYPAVTASWTTTFPTDMQMIGSPLKIPSFMWMHQNDYFCLLDNGVQLPAIRKITLFASEKSPDLLKPNITEIMVYEGDGITMDCMCVRCETPANIWWLYGTNIRPLISMNITANLTHDQQMKRIEMQSISIDKSGTYTCQMKCPSHGCIDEFSIKVNVQTPHTIENMPQNKQFFKCKTSPKIRIIESNTEMPSRIYSCRSPSDNTNANVSIILLGEFYGYTLNGKLNGFSLH